MVLVSLIKSLGRDISTLLLFVFVMGIWYRNQNWYKDKVQELIAFLVITAILSLCTRLIVKPIGVRVTQMNKRYKKTETNCTLSVRGDTQEHERIVDLKVEVERKISLWSWILTKLIARRSITLRVEPVTSGIKLVVFDEVRRQDLSSTNTGFQLHVGDYLLQVLKRSSTGSSHKSCEYQVEEDRNYYITNETFQIEPQLVYNGGQAPWWLNLLIEIKDANHTVNFTRD